MTDTNTNLTRAFQIVMIMAGLTVLIQGMLLGSNLDDTDLAET